MVPFYLEPFSFSTDSILVAKYGYSTFVAVFVLGLSSITTTFFPMIPLVIAYFAEIQMHDSRPGLL